MICSYSKNKHKEPIGGLLPDFSHTDDSEPDDDDDDDDDDYGEAVENKADDNNFADLGEIAGLVKKIESNMLEIPLMFHNKQH